MIKYWGGGGGGNIANHSLMYSIKTLQNFFTDIFDALNVCIEII